MKNFNNYKKIDGKKNGKIIYTNIYYRWPSTFLRHGEQEPLSRASQGLEK